MERAVQTGGGNGIALQTGLEVLAEVGMDVAAAQSFIRASSRALRHEDVERELFRSIR